MPKLKVNYVQLTGWRHKMPARQRSPYSADYDTIVAQLLRELRARSAYDVQVQMFLPPAVISVDSGLPKAGAPMNPKGMSHMLPGVVLVFTSGTKTLEFPAIRYPTWRDNLRAISQTLEDLRRIERNGVGMGQEQYKGYELEAVGQGQGDVPEASAVPPVEVVLAVEKAARELLQAARMEHSPQNILGLMTLPEFRQVVYRRAAKGAHPDQGGSNETMRAVQAAYQTLSGDGVG